MIVTEDEAKTKRCQEAFPAANGVSINGAVVHHSAAALPPHYPGISFAQSSGGAPLNCLGGACMAWQWHHKNTIDGIALGYCGKATP